MGKRKEGIKERDHGLITYPSPPIYSPIAGPNVYIFWRFIHSCRDITWKKNNPKKTPQYWTKKNICSHNIGRWLSPVSDVQPRSVSGGK